MVQKKTFRIPDELWKKVEQKAFEEGWIDRVSENNEQKQPYGMNKYIVHLLSEAVNNQPIPSITNISLEEQFYRAMTKQNEFFQQLTQILIAAAKTEPKINDNRCEQILLQLNQQKRYNADDLQKLTRIPMEEIIVSLGHLFTLGKIGYDEKWRYYKL